MRLNSISPARGSKKEKKGLAEDLLPVGAKLPEEARKDKNQDLEAECVQVLKVVNCLFKRGFLLWVSI